MTTTVAVCIPTIPTREDKLRRAVESANAQILPTNVRGMISIENDLNATGAAPTRNRSWLNVSSDVEWIAFLDDDDELRNNHIKVCLEHAIDTGADLVYPWFNIHDGGGGDISQNDPLRVPVDGHYVSPYGVKFNEDLRTELMTRNNFIPITVLVRRELLADVGGFPVPQTEEWSEDCCEDWGLWRRLLEAGATFEHVPRRTWIWNWHGKNTSGKPWRRRR